MIPNLMMYASAGFLIGIRSKNNNDDVDKAIDELFERTVRMTADTHTLLDELEAVGELEKMLIKLIKN